MNKYLGKIKHQILVLVMCLLLVVSTITGVTYSSFLTTDEGSNNTIKTSDFKIEYCDNLDCSNINKSIIGLDENGNHTEIYPYKTINEALSSTPYIFNIKNNSSFNSKLNIKLVENKDYKLTDEYKNYTKLTDKYSNYLMVAINNCNNIDETLIYKYSELKDNIIIKDLQINTKGSITYCLWIYLDSKTPNDVQSTYFIADINFEGEYIPNNN
jgi:hypothetical protein